MIKKELQDSKRDYIHAHTQSITPSMSAFSVNQHFPPIITTHLTIVNFSEPTCARALTMHP
jgi:hypothetical protein